MTQLLIIES